MYIEKGNKINNKLIQVVMDREQIKNAIKELAKSQGMYGRLLQKIEEYPELLDELEAQNFNDVVDMIMYIEC